MATIKGRNVKIYAGNAIVAACTECDIEMNSDVVEVTGPTSGSARQYIPGRTDWTVTIRQLAVAVKDVLKAGQTVGIMFGQVSGGTFQDDRVSGSAIITKCKISAGLGIVQGNLTLKGSGPLT